MPSKKKNSAAPSHDATDDQSLATATASRDAPVAAEPASADASGQFIGQWNRLVSTTNWEKGRIICQWREALELGGAAATECSDEAWAQLVGGVTSQHVGRLRRVFQKFGGVFDQYEGLYWSHFQAGLDWEDAEMWLEGAILNNWSVSQMRGKRWETLGNAGEAPADPEMEEAEAAHEAFEGEAASAAGRATKSADDSAPWESSTSDADESNKSEANDSEESSSASDSGSYEPIPAGTPTKAKSRSRLAVDVDELPSDMAEAFEQFKLAIIAQRRLGWSEIQPAAVIECLDALRELALAPSDD